jgi:glycerate 2-kinase
VHVLAAPDKFRGTLTAPEAAAAVRRGWLRARPGDDVRALPMADGGEGTLHALVAALDGHLAEARVHGPLGDPIVAQYGLVPGGPEGPTAIIEMARASGLLLVSAARRDPLRASTFGTGELIVDAVRTHAPATVLVCIGGSATTDAGAGMAQALGARLTGANGEQIPPGGAGLLELQRVDGSGVRAVVGTTRFVVACDVDNPLTGPNGAAPVYGPQKGASAEEIVLLDRALGHFAAIAHRDLGIDLRSVPGAGAAGGLGAGLIAFLGARLRPGIEVVMEAVAFREQVRRADLIITGEGRVDEQSFRGKTIAGVLEVALEEDVPAAVVCGAAAARLDGFPVRSLVDRFGLEAALTQTRLKLEQLVEELAGELAPKDNPDPNGRAGPGG